MTGDAPQRNWWGIGIALLIILSIAAIISIAIVLLAPGSSNQYTGKQPISIEDIVTPKAVEANPQPKWMSSDTFAYKDSNCSIWSVHIKGEETTVTQLVDEQSCQNRKFSSFKPSPSGSCIAFAYRTRQIYRHSETARYNITCSLIGVDHDREYPVGPNKTGGELIQLFQWSPGSNDSFVRTFQDNFLKYSRLRFQVFVYNNNIYYQEHILSDAVQVTSSATERNYIRNGVADWVYEEEVLETSEALWWSYTGRLFAYATFDDRNVEKVILPYYPNDSVYPTNVEIAYPKVAASLPVISLYVWDKVTGQTLSVKPPPEVLELKEKYLFSVNWMQSSGTDESLLVVWANRVQNSVFIAYCKPPKYECILNYNQNYDDLWAEPPHYKIRFTDESKYYVILPQLVKESSSELEYRYSHVAQVTIPLSGQNGKATFLTHGSWEVSKIVGHSKKENRVVSANPNGDEPVCLTCNLTKLGCSYVAALFSHDGGHYILHCQGPDIPSVRLFSVGNEKPLFIVEDNSLLRKYFETKRFPDIQYKEVQLPNGYTALLKILYPPDFEEQSNKDFLPAVLKVYAGPNTQSVLERLDFSFDTYLASNRKYVVVYIDGRGSGARGSKYTSSVYRKLGFPEIQDQIEARSSFAYHYCFTNAVVLRIFISQSSLVDRQKTAVWGWSYGGFSTARIVQMNAFQTFKCAISVAPVTNFRLYDATYTERYLGLYENNVIGYDRTNVAKNVTAFGLGKYLLIHGSFDDNVHYQNTAAFVEALTAQNIKFQMMVYTNEKHSISNRRMHLNTLMDDFLVGCFA
ncbi:Dipeptidyl peptidase family [Trichuris trichiura]|uniref:Dipeptidyl peptidase family n=1 Tax=Trichuris trichiura TaxID=36087 RepID=A0A077ZBQ2_TRITR|nr:Dipeptidyl peptidase family [Trichuris trichiura]